MPPEKLYVQGNINLLSKNSIAIVGSRRCTQYGIKYAEKFAKDLAKNNICIISGFAKGVDTVSHISALAEKGKTIAVIGTGFNNIYPEENKDLYKEILEKDGCIVSEFEPEEKVDISKIPRRNRIISGLAMGVLLIEARYRSGSNITARFAIEQNKELFCIPHNLENKTGHGPNYFIKMGAKLVTQAEDILQEFELLEENKIAIDSQYEEIYKYISAVPITANEISIKTNKNISDVNEALFMLEMDGIIKCIPGNKYIISK